MILDVMENILKFIKMYSPGPVKLWIGPYFAVAIIKPEDIQVLEE